MTNHEAWAATWRAAFENMPLRTAKGIDGRYGALARVLELPLYSPAGYSAHNRVYSNWRRGSVPRDAAVRNRLQTYAGPYGKLLAWVKLRKLGIAHRYVKPERF